MYKLGMTRRLEPLERVKELGDASVPFGFDVHAMIYSENAPALECKLHQHFADRRVNLVNFRREFFHVTLQEIIDAVGVHFGDITFVKTPEAAEYRETLAQRKESVPTEPARFMLPKAGPSRPAIVGKDIEQEGNIDLILFPANVNSGQPGDLRKQVRPPPPPRR
jgi:hypothetical protein